MSVTGEPEGEPLKVGVALVDVIAGLYAAVGILAALEHRRESGEGQLVEVDLLSALLAGLVNQSSAYTVAGVVPGRMGNRHPSIAPYELLHCGEGEATRLGQVGGVLEVEREAALVAVDRLEVGRLPPLVVRGPPGAGLVSSPGPLDLRHLGAEVGEHHRRERTGEDAGEVEDAQGPQRAVIG